MCGGEWRGGGAGEPLGARGHPNKTTAQISPAAARGNTKKAYNVVQYYGGGGTMCLQAPAVRTLLAPTGLIATNQRGPTPCQHWPPPAANAQAVYLPSRSVQSRGAQDSRTVYLHAPRATHGRGSGARCRSRPVPLVMSTAADSLIAGSDCSGRRNAILREDPRRPPARQGSDGRRPRGCEGPWRRPHLNGRRRPPLSQHAHAPPAANAHTRQLPSRPVPSRGAQAFRHILFARPARHSPAGSLAE